ncbi:hypothetical protein CHELA40_12087 [Chelatococcus asaccharovorans]|nr:hypothetical protein CHELA40_12087 [Chelatococcus asaccharovorans]CAH1683473.1 hypothetical protein CHELA17_63517 [Chelatococcus asaccharovorans]
MVRRRHLHPPDTGLGANVGATRTTSKLLVLVELLNLTCDLEPHVRRDSHVKFAPLGLRTGGIIDRIEIDERCRSAGAHPRESRRRRMLRQSRHVGNAFRRGSRPRPRGALRPVAV